MKTNKAIIVTSTAKITSVKIIVFGPGREDGVLSIFVDGCCGGLMA
jgi:hypothetical protein